MGLLSGQTWSCSFQNLPSENCMRFDFGEKSQPPSQSNANAGLFISGLAISMSAKSLQDGQK